MRPAPAGEAKFREKKKNRALETAKEERQSPNEELTTVNEELQNRNAELSVLRDDLSNLLSAINVPTVLLGMDGRIRRFTPQAQRLLNLIPSDVGRPLKDLKPNFEMPELESVIRSVIDTVEERQIELQGTDGRWYQLRVLPYRTADKRIDGAVAVFLDIDPIKKSLEEVERARGYSEALIETVRDSLIVLDGDMRVRRVNPAFCETFRTSPSEVQGRPLFELSDWQPKADDFLAVAREVQSSAEGFKTEELEIDFQRLGRRTLLLNARRIALPGEPGPLLLLAIEDITERKTAEAQLRASNLLDLSARREAEGESRWQKEFTGTIVDSSLDGIFAFDRNLKLIVWNLAMERIFGVRKENALGRDAFDALPVLKSIGEGEYFARALAGENVISQDRPYASTTGRQGFFEGHYSPLRDEGGRIIGGLATIREITSRKQFEEHLRQLQKLESLGTLSGGIAHDFNNLLNIISAYTALLAKEDGKKSAARLDAINKAVDRGAALVRQLLTFARKSEVRFETVDVDAVVEDLGKLLKETFPKKFEVKLELADELPAISADPNQLHQALLNLCVNARDAMPGGGRVTLRTEAATQEDVRSRFADAPEARYVLVAVADNGAGMDEATRSRLFEPFFTTKDKGRGAGLGLALVYGIVKSHMGYIDVETKVGRGSEFRIYMPVGAVRSEPREAEPVLQASPRDAAGSETILFAEDEEMLASAVKSLLEAEGYTVLTAKDGVEALDLYRRRRRDIAISILDLQMPRLGGWETCLKIRGIDPAARVVIASGDLDPQQRIRMKKAGIEASIRKPYSAGEIMRTVRRILDR